MFSPTVDAHCYVTKQPCSLYKLQSVQQKWLARLLQTLLQDSPNKCTRFQMYNWPKERLHCVALHSMEMQTGLVKVYACCWCLFENSRSFRGSVLMTAAGNVFRFCRASSMTLSVVQTRLVETLFNRFSMKCGWMMFNMNSMYAEFLQFIVASDPVLFSPEVALLSPAHQLGKEGAWSWSLMVQESHTALGDW